MIGEVGLIVVLEGVEIIIVVDGIILVFNLGDLVNMVVLVGCFKLVKVMGSEV